MLQLVLPFVLIAVIQADDYVHNPIQYHSQTPKGSYNYGYDTGLFGSHSFHQENKDKSGQVRGRYGYTDPDGNLRLTYYTAGPQGFNVVKDTPAPPPPVHDSHSAVTYYDPAPVVHVSSHSRPVPAPCKYRDPPCTQKTEQHINQHVDDKVSVSYSTSSKGTHHQEKQTLVVEPGKEVVHHSTIVSNEPATPQEHRHHHSHHRNHDVHEGIVRVPLPAVVVPQVEPALHSSPLVVHEKSSTHRLSKTFTQAAPVKTVEHHEIKVHEPVKTIQHHEIKVHEPIKTVQHHQVKVQETVKSLHAPVKQSLVQPIAKSYLSPSELFRTRSDHQDRVVVTHSSDGKERYIPNYKPSSPYSRCYCV